MDKELKELLLPFAQAYFRMHHYNSNLSDSPPLYAAVEGCLDECLAAVSPQSLEPAVVFAEEDQQLNVGHLRRVYDFLKAHDALPEITRGG